MDLSHESHLNNGRNPFPILERTPDFDLEHSEDVNERATPVNGHVANRTIMCHEFRDPLLGFNHLLNDLPPFILQIVNFPRMNEERPMLQFHEKSQGATYLIGHVIRFEPPKGKYCATRSEGEVRVEEKRFKGSNIKHAYLFLLLRQMTSTRCDRGPPSRPSRACDHGRPQGANSKRMKRDQGTPSIQRSNQMGLGKLTLTSLLISKRSDTRSSGHSHVEQPLTAELYAILHSHDISRAIAAIPFFVEI